MLTCVQLPSSRTPLPSVDDDHNRDWADTEFGAANLGDARLTSRLVALARRLASSPDCSFPRSLDAAELKAAYRFFDNEQVDTDGVLAPHVEQTLQRMTQLPVVLAVQDTTEFNLTHLEATEGLGYGTGNASRGFMLHSLLVLLCHKNNSLIYISYIIRNPYLCGAAMANLAEFDRYIEHLCVALEHQDRNAGLQDYCRGLMLPIHRKSIEPLAAHTDPLHVAAKHQSLHHFVAKAGWSDSAVMARIRDWVLPHLGLDEGCYWIIDDTGYPKKGTHSVGVARQYCGQLGKSV